MLCQNAQVNMEAYFPLHGLIVMAKQFLMMGVLTKVSFIMKKLTAKVFSYFQTEIELKVKAQNGRGNALYNSGRYPESVVAYHTAIGMDPNSVSGRTLFNMGSSYAAVEMFDDAIKCFTQALERGLDKQDSELCEKQISRCRLLSREQAKRQSRN